MTICYLGLGSNLNWPKRQLNQALSALRSLPHSQISAVSKIYHSKPLGVKAQPNYCNMVVALKTSLHPIQILAFCKKIEQKQGRLRKIVWGSRTIDIDILLYGNQIIVSPRLVLPHPQILLRDFVYVPLLEISQDIRMPCGELLTKLINTSHGYLIPAPIRLDWDNG